MNKFSNGQKEQNLNTDPATPVVLLVDDNALNLQMLHQTLQSQGYRLLSAKSGEDALRIARQALPDLILLDIMMPGIDGYETCARLKANQATQNSVIIFLTALHVNNCLQQHIGLEHSGFIRFQLIPVEEKKVLLIECQPSPSAAFLKIGKDEDFFVRVGPGSRRLSTSEVLSYMSRRKLET
ncbi:MAG: response regulator [Deltaproteobacteria bacterium]|nr:response regulator [Deltaproteobacteria bacterium]